MDKKEAKALIAQNLEKFRDKSYQELVEMIDAEPICFEVIAPSGIKYQIERQAFWDDKKNGDVRVMGSIDDCGWRAFFPLCDDFIKSQTGDFIGE